MHTQKWGLTQFALSMIAVTAVTIAIIFSVFSCGAGKVNFEAEYFFVSYSEEDDAVSAGSISGAVTNLGGAGYILPYNGAFYVTVAAYYDEKDAEKIKFSLLKRGLQCEILKVETGEYPTNSNVSGNKKKLFEGNLNTLDSLSRMAYSCANGLDRGEFDQTAAKEVIKNISNGLAGLEKSNRDNCFSAEIERLSDILGDLGGYIRSKDVRRLQVAILDTIINIKLY